MPEITKGVSFDTIAREWRCKWDTKETLAKVQEVLDGVKSELKKVEGLKGVSRTVCGGCLDFKVAVSVAAANFGDFEKAKFGPEEKFIEALKKIEGVSQVETQTFTIMPVEL
eukprot:jgi/Bigna1/56115/estExt_Genewise1Plus.C_830009